MQELKRMIQLAIAVALVFSWTTSCSRTSEPRSVSLECSNPAPAAQPDALVRIDVGGIVGVWPDFHAERAVVEDDGTQLPTQAVDWDGDGDADEIVCLADFKADETKSLVLRQLNAGDKRTQNPKRTQSMLAVKTGYSLLNGEYTGGEFTQTSHASIPDGHYAHNAYFKFEGPGWESDLVAYRLYLDSRNRIDIFGKKTHEMVLQDVGNSDLVSNHRESYTKEQDWGLDMFRVGESFGIGSFAAWDNGKPVFVSDVGRVECRIVADGDILSAIEIRYADWTVGTEKRNLTALISIWAGSRLTRVDLTLDGESRDFATGLARHDSTVLYQEAGGLAEAWASLALYGAQTLIGDNLGIAVFFDPRDEPRVTQDSLSHVVVLRPHDQTLTYYLAAAWEKEPDGISSAQEFQSYVRRVAAFLESPLHATMTQ